MLGLYADVRRRNPSMNIRAVTMNVIRWHHMASNECTLKQGLMFILNYFVVRQEQLILKAVLTSNGHFKTLWIFESQAVSNADRQSFAATLSDLLLADKVDLCPARLNLGVTKQMISYQMTLFSERDMIFGNSDLEAKLKQQPKTDRSISQTSRKHNFVERFSQFIPGQQGSAEIGPLNL